MRCCARAAVCAAILLASAVTARAQPSSSAGPVRLLDVPYIQQSEALCGGAAVAMVMRYWGATGVYAETFAPLVDQAAGGIRGEDLLRDLNGRGWNARSFGGDPTLVRARLAAGQPVIALIEDRPGAYHYVVIVAWANGRVVQHDPARAPFRVINEEAFVRAWNVTGRWTLLALPPEAVAKRASGSVVDGTDVSTARTASGNPACEALVAEGVTRATAGDHETALQTLAAAADACPADAAPWREMAGVHALKESWTEAARHAREAVGRDPRDEHAWRILATSRYVTDDFAGALEAWNAVGEPLLDIVNIGGLEHTRHASAASALRLQPQTVLTRAALSAAARRLADVPAAQVARVSYRPLESGRAAVDAVMIERPRSPFGITSLAVASVRALSNRELTLASANPTGAGDLAIVSWRWWENRPHIAASYAAPLSIGGVLRTDIYRDEQTYGLERIGEVRKGGSVAWSDWTATNLRWQTTLGFDTWGERGKTLALSAAIEQRAWGDRVALDGSATIVAGNFSAWTGNAGVHWRSSLRNQGAVFLARGGVELASDRAPLALWPGAGHGHARPTLLRAHALLDDGVITGGVFGRRVYSAGAEWRAWSRPLKGALRFAPAAFVDAARAERRLTPNDQWHVDAGAGLRIALPGSNILRIDVAKGVRDGKTAFSVGWMR